MCKSIKGLALLALIFAALPTLAQNTAIKTNLLYWATTTPNIDIEQRLSPKLTAGVSVGYNPFSFSNNTKLKHIAVQPEVRYWPCQAFSGHFFGANAMYSHYNAGNINLPMGIFPGLKNYRYQGNIGGVGLTYGYNLILSPRWSLEFEAGLGLMFTKYDKYECRNCGSKVATESKTFLAPSRVAVSMVYYLK